MKPAPSRSPPQRAKLRSVLDQCTDTILQATSTADWLQRVCAELVDAGICKTAWVGQVDAAKSSLLVLACGHLPSPLTLGVPQQPTSPYSLPQACAAAIASARPVWNTTLPCPLLEDPVPSGGSVVGLPDASAVIPLVVNGQARWVLCLHALKAGVVGVRQHNIWLPWANRLAALLSRMPSPLSELSDQPDTAAPQLTMPAPPATKVDHGPPLTLLQNFVDQLPGTVFLKDEQLRLLLGNRFLAHTLGKDPGELVGLSNVQLFPPDFAEAVNQLDRAVLSSGQPRTVPQTFGDQHWETRLFAVQDAGQQFLGGISLDVTAQVRSTERTQALLTLNELANRLDERTLLTEGLEMAERLTYSAIGFLHFVNEDQETLELVTWTAGALKGCTAAHDSHYPISAAGAWADCFRTRQPVIVNDYPQHHAKHGLPDGHAHLARFISVPVVEGDRVWLMLGVGNKQTDYTPSDVETLQLVGNDLWRMVQRRRANQQLQQRLTELEEANAKLADMQLQLLQSEKMASIGQLAAGVAHEINNPIGFVRSNLSMLSQYVHDLVAVTAGYETAEAELGPAHQAAFKAVQVLKTQVDHTFRVAELPDLIAESQDGIERVRKIVQDLKNFSRSGDADWQWSDLTQGLESTINIAWNQIKYKAELRRDYQPLPQVYCVASQINQVIMNLLVNAAQAITSNGVITVRTGSDADNVWIEVEDTGCGMTPDQIKRIYEPFFTTKPPGQGTGLGLAIAWRVMEKHGGHIDVTSTPDQGSTFRMCLPLNVRCDHPAQAVPPVTTPANAQNPSHHDHH